VFYQFIADRFKDADYSGSLIIKILEVYHILSPPDKDHHSLLTLFS